MADTLQELQELVVRFRDERDWEQFHTPKDLVLGLQVEAAMHPAAERCPMPAS